LVIVKTDIPCNINAEFGISCYLCPINLKIMTALLLPLAIGPWQIAIIVLVILLLFGGRKIPELMRGLGSGIK